MSHRIFVVALACTGFSCGGATRSSTPLDEMKERSVESSKWEDDAERERDVEADAAPDPNDLGFRDGPPAEPKPAPTPGKVGSLSDTGGLRTRDSGRAKSAPPVTSGETTPLPRAGAERSDRDSVGRDAERLHADLRKEEARKGEGSGAAGSSGDADKPRAGRKDGDWGTPAPAPVVTAPAMRAGRHDDNKQYNRFLQFLGDNSDMVAYPVNVTERLVVRTLDHEGKSLHNCSVEVIDLGGKLLITSTSYADGSTQFFPADAGPADARDYALRARCGSEIRNGQLGRTGRRVTDLRFGQARQAPARVPVDIAVVIDTTGSMQSQIDRLKKTLKAIHFQLTALSTKPDIRFGLVAYRDRGDDYVTQPYDFTRDVSAFQRVLDTLDADGGGDTPEDLQAALADALHKLSWRDDALRLGFVVADAVPHTDYGQSYTYRDAMREALKRGIKWSMVGAGGLPRQGEVIFRQIAQFSMGEYVFITDSAAGDHEGGVGEASHHVGTNYVTENLDQAIVRIVRRELSYLTDAPKDFDDTIVATADKGVSRDEVLAPAVAEVLRQLADYSSMRLKALTPVAVVPVTVNDAKHKDVAEYLSDKMILAASRNPALRVVERDMSAVAQEMKLQLSELFDVTETVPLGKMVGADVLIVAKLTVRKDGASLFAKLVRVETGEVLSVAQVDIGGNVLKSS